MGNRIEQPVGLILAGGKGMRMGGVSKADVVLGSQTLLARAEARLEPQVAALAVSTNAPVETVLPCVADGMPGHLGPLAGILAGLDWAASRSARHMVSVAVDTPFFPPDLVPRLMMAGELHADGLAVAATSDGLHGTFGIWPVSLRDDLAAFLTGGGRKVRAFTDAQRAAAAPFRETTPPTFFNINTPEDLAKAESWL